MLMPKANGSQNGRATWLTVRHPVTTRRRRELDGGYAVDIVQSGHISMCDQPSLKQRGSGYVEELEIAQGQVTK